MLRAVLFDWGETLCHIVYERNALIRGMRAGLQATGRIDVPDPKCAADRLRSAYLRQIASPPHLREVDWPSVLWKILASVGTDLAPDELERFVVAEHAERTITRTFAPSAPRLLDEIRSLGLRTGIVSNAYEPPWLLRNDLERLRLLSRCDITAFSSEVGRRKPHPKIFEFAVARLGVSPGEVIFVGDSRYDDILGARKSGLGTIQARWFRVDNDPRGVDADFVADNLRDVLAIVLEVMGRR
jgi:HAD superfamily hydrolase (TIGR01509 family)